MSVDELKSEARNSKSETNPKSELPNVPNGVLEVFWSFGFWSFGHCFDIRYSDFEFNALSRLCLFRLFDQRMMTSFEELEWSICVKLRALK